MSRSAFQYAGYGLSASVAGAQARARFGTVETPPRVLTPEMTVSFSEIASKGKAGLVIGREGDLTLGVLDTSTRSMTEDDLLSRRHAQLLVENNYLFARDLGSSNGTRVSADGVAATAKPLDVTVGIEMKPGTKLHIGNQILEVTPSRSLALFSPQADWFQVLFPRGVAEAQLQQKNTGDCYLLAALYALSRNVAGQRHLARMIQGIGSPKDPAHTHQWVVQFPDLTSTAANRRIAVTALDVFGQVTDAGRKSAVQADLGWRVLERAYGRHRKAGIGTGQHRFKTMHVVEGGFGHRALHDLTGWQKAFILNGKEDRDHTEMDPADEAAFAGLLDRIGRDPHRYVATVNTPSNRWVWMQNANQLGHYAYIDPARPHAGYYLDPERRFISNHAYALAAVDVTGRRVAVVNPHDTSKCHWISYKAFYQYFSSIAMVVVPQKELMG